MHLINYDFYDLHALITFFRQKTERFSSYKKAFEEIICCIEMPMQNNGITANTIRKIIRPYIDSDDELLSWVLTDNMYTANVVIIKNEGCYRLLSAVFKEMLQFADDTQRLYSLCDAAHNIPLVLADDKKPQKAIKAMIKDYRNTQNKHFLSEELKSL
ncbi:MAG: hypothetical protein MSH60_00435 [Ruminococcus sp.]|nr:hypothetical protein [Ruminococcus sp.]